MHQKIKSSSIHNYNADTGLGFFQKFFYLFLNFLNNTCPYLNLDKRISIRNFNGGDWKKHWDKTYKNSSVGRKLSDLFWWTLPWDQIISELGEVNVFDTGCGSGGYGVRLFEASGGRVASYVGIDAKPKQNWAELSQKYPNFHLLESKSSDISPLIPKGANLFITQSAIEHFDEDVRFFEQINNHVKNTNKPVIQVHIFPAGASLPLYIFHGIRQYVPRTISKITKLFNNSSSFFLFGLGGKSGKKLQWKYFTWPVLISRKFSKPTFDVDLYEKELKLAVEHDFNRKNKSPIFWALIIHSNQKQKIW